MSKILHRGLEAKLAALNGKDDETLSSRGSVGDVSTNVNVNIHSNDMLLSFLSPPLDP